MGSESFNDIPVLNDIADSVQAARRSSDSAQFRAQLEAHLTAVIHEQADELVHTACREMEALLIEQVSDRLKA
ncbi:MAG: hypothetical protein ACR2I8_00480, partial [Steroidobacteraceae bacterium]